MESIRQNLVWRINTIHPSLEEPPLGILHCLPSSVSDPFGRPIIVLKVSALAAEHSTDDFKLLLMPTINHLQLHLKELNALEERKERPILQYVVLLDLAEVSIQHVVCKLAFVTLIVMNLLQRMLT
jgi:retinaldehyde-binding protein 1